MTAKTDLTGNCRGCHAPVLWLMSVVPRGFDLVDSRRMPVNPEPDEKGNVVMLPKDRIRVLGGTDLEFMRRNFPHKLYTSHFDSCPKAKDFRREKKRFG